MRHNRQLEKRYQSGSGSSLLNPSTNILVLMHIPQMRLRLFEKNPSFMSMTNSMQLSKAHAEWTPSRHVCLNWETARIFSQILTTVNTGIRITASIVFFEKFKLFSWLNRTLPLPFQFGIISKNFTHCTAGNAKGTAHFTNSLS